MRLALLLAFLPALAHAQSVDLPAASLPGAEPAGPSLWFGPADVPALQARRGSPHYLAARALVDANLGSLAANASALGDDTLTQVAKCAALLEALGEVPPRAFARYRDAAVAAVLHVGGREAVTVFNAASPPADAIDVLRDSPRLQSMAEAYDLLRGSGVSAADDAGLRARIANWADALHDDVNLQGAFGYFGHRDNWGIKGGASLITAALALSAHPNAGGWLGFGNTLVHDSLQITGSSAGWYRESAHYLTYALDNLFSTAVHVSRRGGVDWFPALAPFASAALDLRQPDGSFAAFEEGVPGDFPFDVFAPRYPDLGGQLAWAWANSARDADAYGNQQPVEATRFLAGELPPAVAPAGRPSRFVGGDAHISALRSGFDAQAVQATLYAARDSSSQTLVASRHNLQNPLDLVVAGAGKILLPTSGGGPQVTNSANRAYYLQPASKNVPLVAGTAPFVTDDAQIAVDQRLAGEEGRYLELVRSRITGAYAAPVRSVARTVALVASSAVAVLDELDAAGSVAFALPWHGRGTRSSTGALRASWSFQGAALDLVATGAPQLTLAPVAGFTAPAYGVEEAIDGVELRASGAGVRALTVLLPRAAPAAPAEVEDRSTPPLLALRITSGGVVVDHLAAGGGTDGVSTDARFSAVRERAGQLEGFGALDATTLSFAGAQVLQSSRPLTLSLSVGVAGALVTGEISQDQPFASTFFLGSLPGFDPGVLYRGAFAGKALSTAQLTQDALGVSLRGLAGGGSLRIEASGPQLLAAPGDQTVLEGSTLAFTLVSAPPPGQALSFSLETRAQLLPAPALDPASGAFSWTPAPGTATPAAPRDVLVTFVATLASGAAVRQPCRIRVLGVEHAPSLRTPPATTVRRGGSVHLALEGSDPDGDALTYSFRAAPGLVPAPTLDAASGAFDWAAPLDAPLGDFAVPLRVSDGRLAADADLLLHVAPENRAPRFTQVDGHDLADPLAATVSATAGLGLSVAVLAVDDDGDALHLRPAGALPAGAIFSAGEGGSGTLRWPAPTAGETAIVLHAADDFGGKSDLRLTVVARAGGCSSSGSPGALVLLLLWAASRRRRKGGRPQSSIIGYCK